MATKCSQPGAFNGVLSSQLETEQQVLLFSWRANHQGKSIHTLWKEEAKEAVSQRRDGDKEIESVLKWRCWKGRKEGETDGKIRVDRKSEWKKNMRQISLSALSRFLTSIMNVFSTNSFCLWTMFLVKKHKLQKKYREHWTMGRKVGSQTPYTYLSMLFCIFNIKGN